MHARVRDAPSFPAHVVPTTPRSPPPTIMAFQVPSHLPRRAAPQDVTSAILTKMDEATAKTLDAAQARVWLGDLDETIAATRVSCVLCIRDNG